MPSFVHQPGGNDCVERFMRTLKEQLLRLRSFRNLEELRKALRAFKRNGLQFPRPRIFLDTEL